MEALRSVFGIVAMLAIAWGLSERRGAVAWRPVWAGIALAAALLAAIRWVPGIRPLLESMNAVLDALVLGTDRVRYPRLVWKRFDTRVVSVESFAFDLTSSTPFQIVGFSFDAYLVDASGARVSRE